MAALRIYRSFRTIHGIASRYRASLRRIQRLRMRDDWPVEMWILIIALIALGFMAPRLAQLHDEFHHPHAQHR